MTNALVTALLITASPTLKVGVTLHPYYSWVANISQGLPIEVVPVLPADVDVDGYQPTPRDVATLADLDALIINGIGHDDFILDMLRASGNSKCRVIRPNDATPLLHAAHGEAINPHTFLSYSNAIQQTTIIARELTRLAPAQREGLEHNAERYVRILRAARSVALARARRATHPRVVTVHDGYAYFLLELGIESAGVVEPAHGLIPSASELSQTIELLRREKVTTVLSETSFPSALTDVLTQAGAKVTLISHIAVGPYSPEAFEKEMAANVDSLMQAVGEHL